MSTVLKSIELTGFDKLEAAWAKAPDIVRHELETAMRTSGIVLENAVKALTPTSNPGAQGASNLKGSITRQTEVSGERVLGVVGTPQAYAIPVELGTRPHIPPITPLIDWVMQKFPGMEEKEAVGFAHAIKWTIARRGTLGVGMFHRGFAHNEGKVRDIFEDARRKIRDRLAGAGAA